jgi:hypothetical protein
VVTESSSRNMLVKITFCGIMLGTQLGKILEPEGLLPIHHKLSSYQLS